MTKEEFLNKFKDVFQDKNVNVKNIHEGSMKKEDIESCTFLGIYIILQEGNVIYIGSAYAGERSVADRLKQYLSDSKTGNTLANAFVRERNITFDEAMTEILKCRFMAFEYKDLEYELIKGCPGLLNYSGNKQHC